VAHPKDESEEHECADAQQNDLRPFLDAYRGDQQTSDDCRAEIPGGSHQTAGDTTHRHEALGEPTRVWLDRDRGHSAADEYGRQRVTALVDPRREQLERIEEELRPWREADEQ